MDNIIKFYKLNEKDLINYNRDSINKLLFIIKDTADKMNNDDWVNNCTAIIEECVEVFSIMNFNYLCHVDDYIIKLRESIPHDIKTKIINGHHKYVIRKVNLYIQLLEYLKMVNYNTKVFFDKQKYDIVIDSYNIFFNLIEDINKSYVEWYSNNYIFYYSQSTKYTNICIYCLDDMFGYKIFLTLKINNLTNEIKLCIYDAVIKTREDFYNKIEKINDHRPRFIDIEQIINCFSLSSNDIAKEYHESNYVESFQMLQYVNYFLNE